MSRKPTETKRVQRLYDRMAPRYDRVIAVAERLLFTGGREWACGQASGDVLEVAVGTGRDLAFYAPGVRLTAVDVSEKMLARARRRACALDLRVELRVADAQCLDFADASFDTVVATLSLCSIPDHTAAVAEMARVLRPGGRLRLLDHVGSPNPAVRLVQRVLDPLAVRLQGDHLLRSPELPVRAANLDIEQLHRTRAGIVLALAARKPGPPPVTGNAEDPHGQPGATGPD